MTRADYDLIYSCVVRTIQEKDKERLAWAYTEKAQELAQEIDRLEALQYRLASILEVDG